MTPQTFTIEFPSAAEAHEHLAALGYVRAPMRGIIRRFQARLYGDNGEAVLSLASSGFVPADNGAVTVSFADYAR